MKIDPVLLNTAAAIIVGFVVKLAWDWVQSGRVEKKGVYVTIDHCEGVREKCCITTLKRDVGIIENRMGAAEKRLDDGREDFKLLRKDIGGIDKSMAGIQAVLKEFLKERG